MSGERVIFNFQTADELKFVPQLPQKVLVSALGVRHFGHEFTGILIQL
tara:strand:- start:640 stop:783 length:144 start_codon:yes stop_codon:yes gene_type:complete